MYKRLDKDSTNARKLSVKSCYSMLVNKCNSGVTNCASRVRDILYKHGYGYVWEAQGLIEVDTILYEFSSTIMDSEIQMWNTKLHNSLN